MYYTLYTPINKVTNAVCARSECSQLPKSKVSTVIDAIIDLANTQMNTSISINYDVMDNNIILLQCCEYSIITQL